MWQQQRQKKTFQNTNGQYQSQLKRYLRGEEYRGKQNLMEAELGLLAEDHSQLILEDKKAKGELR